MNWKVLTLAMLLARTVSGQGTSTFLYDTGNATIPDNDGNGYLNVQNVSGLSGAITDINVTLTVLNVFNGDLYAWVSHGSGLAVLLNRVGVSSSSTVGYGDAGFGSDTQQNLFTFSDQSSADVHLYQDATYSLNPSHQLIGTWQPDGRIIDPGSPGSLFDTAPRSNMLGVFDGLDANGPWTLFVADLSPGGVGTLVSWGMEITSVPEPASGTLLSWGLAGGALWFARMRVTLRRPGRRAAQDPRVT